MALDSLHLMLGGGFISFVSALSTGIAVNWFKDRKYRDCVTHDELDALNERTVQEWKERCDNLQRNCTGHSIARQVSELTELFRVFAEKSGFTRDEQLAVINKIPR